MYTTRNLLTWATDCFLSYAKEIGVLNDSQYDEAMRTALASYNKYLKCQQTMAKNNMPQGNLAWYILECCKNNEFLIVDTPKELFKNENACKVKNNMLLVRLKTNKLNLVMPGALFTPNSLGKQLREQGIIASKAEGKSEMKRIGRKRCLEIDLQLLKKLAVKLLKLTVF